MGRGIAVMASAKYFSMYRTFPCNDPAKRLYHHRVELCPRAVPQLPNCVSVAHRIAVRALGGHGVEGVADGHDAGAERDLVPAQTVGIAAAVPALVARAHEPGNRPQRRRREQDALAYQR